MDQNTTGSGSGSGSGSAGDLHYLTYDFRAMVLLVIFGMPAVSFLVFVCLVWWVREEYRQRKESLRLLPVVTYRRDGEATAGCVVCLGDFEEGEELKMLRCRHVFHPDCIEQWILRRHRSCPVCRSPEIFTAVAVGEEQQLELQV